MMRSLTELYIMNQNKETEDFVRDSPKEEILEAVERVFAEGLRGTCLDTWEAQLDAYGLNMELILTRLTEDEVLETLDSTVFECAGCGWWCSVDESNSFEDENFCDQCITDVVDEENEDDEE